MDAFIDVLGPNGIQEIRTTDIIALEPADPASLHWFEASWRSGNATKRGLVDVHRLITNGCILSLLRPEYGEQRMASWFRKHAPQIVAEFFQRRAAAENWLRNAEPAGMA